MNQSFLNSLVGLPVANAEKKVLAAGHEADVIPSGYMRASIASPNTVILWTRNNRVSSAESGDPVEVIQDV
jgi:hypothetical protein